MKHRPTHLSLLCIFSVFFLVSLKASEFPLIPIYKETTKNSSESTQTTTQDPITTMLCKQISSIDEDINTTYNKHSDGLLGYWGLGSNTVSPDDMATIVNKISLYSNEKKIIKALLNALYKKNELFKFSVDFFRQEAWNNIQHVTCNTLTTIENPMQQQPIPVLNLLSSVVRLPIIKLVLIERSHTIKLTGHTGKICSYDICVATGHAVTTSRDKTIRIWDLNNGGTCILNFSGPYYKHDVCFNSTGTHIATIENMACGTSIIRQWKINGQQLDQTHIYESLGGYLGQISYMDNGADNMIVAITGSKDYQKRCHTIFMLQDGGNIVPLGSTYTTSELHGKTVKNYEKLRYSNHRQFDITKNNCRGLYLCEQAIKNSPATTTLQPLIEKSQTYQQLSPYEQNMVQKQIQEKVVALQGK